VPRESTEPTADLAYQLVSVHPQPLASNRPPGELRPPPRRAAPHLAPNLAAATAARDAGSRRGGRGRRLHPAVRGLKAAGHNRRAKASPGWRAGPGVLARGRPRERGSPFGAAPTWPPEPRGRRGCGPRRRPRAVPPPPARPVGCGATVPGRPRCTDPGRGAPPRGAA
jgi:hypothetical protein